MAPPLATATRRVPSAEVATEVQLLTPDVQLVTTVGPAADQVKRVPPQFVVPGGMSLDPLRTAANLVPSAHVATERQTPQNRATVSSAQPELGVSVLMKDEWP